MSGSSFYISLGPSCSLRMQTYFRLSLVSADKRQPEIRLCSQATPRGAKGFKLIGMLWMKYIVIVCLFVCFFCMCRPAYLRFANSLLTWELANMEEPTVFQDWGRLLVRSRTTFSIYIVTKEFLLYNCTKE